VVELQHGFSLVVEFDALHNEPPLNTLLLLLVQAG
jgi:hypothetical protein